MKHNIKTHWHTITTTHNMRQNQVAVIKCEKVQSVCEGDIGLMRPQDKYNRIGKRYLLPKVTRLNYKQQTCWKEYNCHSDKL